MKKALMTIMALMIGAAGICLAARRNAEIPVMSFSETPTVTWQGDSLVLTFSADPSLPLKGMDAVTATPLYILGNDTLRFPEIGIFSPQAYKYFKRRENFSRHPHVMKTFARKKKNLTPAVYNEYIIAPNNPNARLIIERAFENCCKTIRQETMQVWPMVETVHTVDTVVIELPPVVEVVTDTVVMYVPEPVVPAPDTVAAPEPKKLLRETIDLHINYHVNGTDIDPMLGKNRQQLRDMVAHIMPLSDTTVYRIDKIYVTGYASPDGDSDNNRRLSEGRAQSMRTYLYESGLIDRSIPVECEGKGEDWDGLRNLVEESLKPWSKAACDIIDSYDVYGGLKTRLMNLQGGEPYRYMKSELFPKLRRIELSVEYDLYK